MSSCNFMTVIPGISLVPHLGEPFHDEDIPPLADS